MDWEAVYRVDCMLRNPNLQVASKNIDNIPYSYLPWGNGNIVSVPQLTKVQKICNKLYSRKILVLRWLSPSPTNSGNSNRGEETTHERQGRVGEQKYPRKREPGERGSQAWKTNSKGPIGTCVAVRWPWLTRRLRDIENCAKNTQHFRDRTSEEVFRRGRKALFIEKVRYLLFSAWIFV